MVDHFMHDFRGIQDGKSGEWILPPLAEYIIGLRMRSPHRPGIQPYWNCTLSQRQSLLLALARSIDLVFRVGRLIPSPDQEIMNDLART